MVGNIHTSHRGYCSTYYLPASTPAHCPGGACSTRKRSIAAVAAFFFLEEAISLSLLWMGWWCEMGGMAWKAAATGSNGRR